MRLTSVVGSLDVVAGADALLDPVLQSKRGALPPLGRACGSWMWGQYDGEMDLPVSIGGDGQNRLARGHGSAGKPLPLWPPPPELESSRRLWAIAAVPRWPALGRSTNQEVTRGGCGAGSSSQMVAAFQKPFSTHSNIRRAP
jgi:hypothetical protein